MPADFANSETLKNLMRAFAGESQARNRYTFAAAQCRGQKLHVLEAVFRFTANQEKEHAEIFYRHMQSFAGGTVHIDGGYPVDLTEDVVDLLRRARHGEYQEHQEVYPAFAETARQEGFDAIARRIYRFEEVEAVFLMSGAYDLMVLIKGDSMRQIAFFVAQKLATIDGVLSTATHFVLKKYKELGVVFETAEEEARLPVTP